MKKIVFILVPILLIIFSACSCSTQKDPVFDIPADFTFSLTWNCYGVSSYDSDKGKLVKTNDATVPNDYITTLLLDEEQKEAVRNILSTIDFDKYPTEYNPNEGIESEPSMTLILTVQYKNTNKSISCKNIALSYDSPDNDGQVFLSACESIINIIVNTSEWNALPDYEFFYE